jgi:hypothetical protein
MSLFAKLLAVLNVLAAIAFLFLAVLDLSRGTPWRYAVWLHDKNLEGPPLGTPDPNLEREEALDDVFEPARDKLAQEVADTKGDDAAKRQALERTLLAWARPGQRAAVRQNLDATQTVNLNTLLKDLREPLRNSEALAKVRPLVVVNTQQEELQRWHDYLLADIKERKGDEAKRARLADILLPLAETLSERTEMARRIQNESVDKLLAGPFESAFPKAAEVATASGQPGPEPKESRDKRSRDIAHLLFALSQMPGPDGRPDPATVQRTKVVVGLRAYNREVERQALRLREMVQELRAAMYLGKYSDRAQFIAQHQEIAQQLQQLVFQLDAVTAALKGRQEELGKLEEQVKARRDVVKNHQVELEKAKADTQKELDKQAGQEKELFDAQRATAEAAHENARLEQDIRRLEGLPDGRKK